MRITVWNTNGLRTLKGYQPWYKLPDWEACLEHLGADIACFQETKMTRKQLTEQMCILPSYNAFFNFHPQKGYSGTVTYVRKSVAIPLKAEQGITGRLRITNVSTNPAIPNDPIGCVPADTRDDVDPQTWEALDQEGRCVVLDLGLFVLFNVYCPNETGPERLDYKMTYYQCLAERAHRLIREGRQVMIVGDMNIIRDPIDHCDPEQSMREHGWTHFHQHPARSWFKSFLVPQGKFHDVGRMYHPDRRKMFTCWNTLIDARPANYGCRLDYILATEGLLPWIKGADIQADIYGSDHCPVYVDLHDEREVDGKILKLADLMHGNSSHLPPALAACHYDEFSGKQRKLASFFVTSKKPAHAKKNNTTCDVPSVSQASSTAELRSSIAQASDGASTLVGNDGRPTSLVEEAGEEGSSLADGLFSLHSQQEGLDIEVAPQLPSEGSDSASTVSTPAQLTRQAVQTLPSASASSASAAPPTSSRPDSQPSPKPKRKGNASPEQASSALKGKNTIKSKNGASLKGQTNLQAFFAKPKSASSTAPKRSLEAATSSSKASLFPHQVEEDEDGISEFQESASPSLQRAVPASSSEQSAADRVGASLAWGAIFSPAPAPLCRSHSEPCRAWTVNKPGPNHGRKFWLCARPVGPGYEKSGRAKGDVNPEYRCNFFLWDSELRSKKRQTSSEAVGNGEGKFFSEVGRECGRRKGRNNEQQDAEELGGPWGPHKRVKAADT